jgi:YVTN family beta-propeller protein
MVTLNPVGVTTATTGFNQPEGILYDGANIWVTDIGTTPGRILELDSNGGVLKHISVGNAPQFPVFDGTNIWVPNNGSNTLTVIRASTGAVLATLSGNGLNGPSAAAFDGERILVTNPGGDSVSVWKAADLSPIGAFGSGLGSGPIEACSDGINFWIALFNTGKLARF